MDLRLDKIAFSSPLVVLLLIFLGCAKEENFVLVDQVVRTNGLLRLKGSGELYTGYLVDHYKDSEQNLVKSRSLVLNGKLNGLSEGWYSSGQLQVSEIFSQGKSHGVRKKWHINGRKEAEDSIENGELNGLCQKWHDNGRLAEEMTMVKGKANGLAKSWHEDGSLKAEVLLKMGEVVEQKFWKIGEKPGHDSESIFKGYESEL